MDEEIESSVRIPDFVRAEPFVAARIKELSALTGLMRKTNRVTSIFQRLPKRMRRRTMSHTVKRVPRSLREAHRRQLVKNKAMQKPKSRRKFYRKRPKQLLLEYNRRQKKNRWLETHIWHAKRFRMQTKWGYKLADHSYDKTFKASHRAMKSHCLIQDVSHYGCIEVTGPETVIVEGLSLMTCAQCGPSAKAKSSLSGHREGRMTLYHSRSFPQDVIGSVSFMWRPSTETHRALWLWSHPAFYHEVLDELIEVFSLKLADSEDEEMDIFPPESMLPSQGGSKQKEVEKTIINLKNVPVSKSPRYLNHETNVVVSSLKDTLNRFRLCGPLSNAVLTKALHPAELFAEILKTTGSHRWWTNRKRHQLSALELLETYSLPSHFPSHVIMSDYVVDPRLFLKRKREKAVPFVERNEHCLSVSHTLSDNQLWNADVRDEVSLMKFSSARINKLRGELLVPGFDEQLLQTINSVIPLIFIQNPGLNCSSVKAGFGSGWDIIVPANWAMPVWLSLILCGAKPGGLRETNSLQFETQNMPELFPDSQAGTLYYDDLRKECKDSYFSKPPNKRVNFIKHGIQTPFHYPWQTLVDEWSSSKSAKKYFVFRNVAELRKVRAYIDSTRKRNALAPNFSFEAGSLIAVVVSIVDSGGLTPFSHICLPTEADVRYRIQNKMFAGPHESVHPDIKREERKRLRLAQTKLLKRLRRKRMKSKRSRISSDLPLKITKRKVSPTVDVVDAYLQKTQDLWIPPAIPALRNHCDRQICGFVINSGFSFTRACTVGLGFITSESFSLLLNLYDKFGGNPMVLTRTPYSLSYRFCTINVIDS